MYARLGEIISLDSSIAVTLAAHQAIGLKVRGWGFRGGEGAAGSASRRKARCPAASLYRAQCPSVALSFLLKPPPAPSPLTHPSRPRSDATASTKPAFTTGWR